MLPVDVARSSSNSVAIRYVLPVLWMALFLLEVRQVAVAVGRQDNYRVWSSSSECGTGGESAIYDLPVD